MSEFGWMDPHDPPTPTPTPTPQANTLCTEPTVAMTVIINFFACQTNPQERDNTHRRGSSRN